MKVSVESIIQSQLKTGNRELLLKILSKVSEVDTDKTFVLSPTGGEIHSGSSVVDRVTKPESLREKIARFDRLAERVAANRAYLMSIGQEMAGEEDFDDFDFVDGEDFDSFGDSLESPIGEEPAGQARAPQNAGAPEKQGDEPVDDASDLSTDSDPE